MSVIKKTISISEDIYKEIQEIENSKNFSKVVQKALKEYLEKRKKEKIMSFAGVLKDWEIEDGKEFVDKIRREDIETQKERENNWDI
jgi:predicted CopG family antitoxin